MKEERKELNYDNLPPMEKLQIDYTFLQSDFTDYQKKVENIVNFGRDLQDTDDSGSLAIILNQIEEVFRKADKCYHFPELKQLVLLCMEETNKKQLETLKVKVKKAIEVIEKLEINEVSKQGGISALKLILNE